MAKTQLNSKGIKDLSIVDADISLTANIAQSKINGLTSALNGKQNLLPAQSGNNGKYLKTDGTNLSWSSVGNSGGGIVSSFTHIIDTASWTYDNLIYRSTITNSNITSTSYVEVIPENNSVVYVIEAEFFPKVTIETEQITIYAKYIPTNPITVTVNVITSIPNIYSISTQSSLNIDGSIYNLFDVTLTSTSDATFSLSNMVIGVVYYVLIKNESTNNINIILPNSNAIIPVSSFVLSMNKAVEVSILYNGTRPIFQLSEELTVV